MDDFSNNGSSHTLLAIMAHPDDESFGIGGTLALYAARGAQVHLITATGGEAGTVDDKYLQSNGSIASLRTEQELSCAASELGLAEVHLLGYRDSGMPGSVDNQHPDALINAPLDRVAEKIAILIRLIQPDIVITHDPIGGYKHPDHIALHKATVEAFKAAGNADIFLGELPPFEPQALYYSIFPRIWLRRVVRILPWVGLNPRQFGRNKDIDLVELANEKSFPIHVTIDYREVAEKKEKASACHASQLAGGPTRSKIFDFLRWLAGPREHFMQALPNPPTDLKQKDLFKAPEIRYN